MVEIPEVYGEWPEPPCCGDPGDCQELCAFNPWIAPVVLMSRAEIEAKYGPPIAWPS